MPVKFRRTAFRTGDSYRITIPMEIIRALDIKSKDILEIWLNNSQIIMEKPNKKQPEINASRNVKPSS